MVAETPPVLQSPKLLGPRPLGQQSAACPCASPTMASSGSSSTSSGTFALGPCGRITSQGICGWPGQGLSANVLTPLPPENGWDPSARPGVPRRQVCPNSEGVASFVHLAPLAHTWLLRSLFWEDSVVSGGVLRGAGAGVAGWWEQVLCWDEALYPHIFLWEWESGSSVALLPLFLLFLATIITLLLFVFSVITLRQFTYSFLCETFGHLSSHVFSALNTVLAYLIFLVV